MTETGLLLPRVLALIRKYGVRSVCDRGCGRGELLERLGAALPGALVLTGVDYFSAMCAEHRPKPGPGVRLVDRGTAEFEQLAARPGFDLVLSCWALHHYRLPVAELKAVTRMLNPGGLLFLTDWEFGGDEPGQVVKDILSLLDEAGCTFAGRYHRHHYTLAEAQDLIGALDLVPVESSTGQLEETEVERREGAAAKLAQVRARMDAVGDRELPEVWREFHQAQLALVARLVERHGVDYSRYFTIISRKQSGT